MAETTTDTSPNADGSMVIDLDSRVDDMHKAVLSLLPPDLLDLSDIESARARLAGLMDAMPSAELPDTVTVTERLVPGIEADDPDVMVKIYTPDRHPSANGDGPATAALYWIHGGGLVLGEAAMNDGECARIAELCGVVVGSVEYRLAPEHPYPAPINDCMAGLQGFAGAADELHIDPERIVIGGASAGGGLAASLALRARDEGGPAIAAQLLVYPMLDDRNTTPSSHAVTDFRVWNRAANQAGWAAYLGDAVGTDGVSPHAAAARATDLSGLPPAYINVGTLDMFHDEDVAYALALNRAGVDVELHTYPGAFHGSNGFVADSELSKRWTAEEDAFLVRMLAG